MPGDRRLIPIETPAPPWTMTPRDIARVFDGATAASVVRSVVVRLAEEIRSGREPAVRGNLRTVGYRYLLPVWTHVPHLGPDGWYTRLVRETRRLVTDRGVVSYVDMGITDENWEARRIGTRLPHVVAFAEDLDFVRLFRRVHEELGVTTVAFSGTASALTAEYTARHIRRALGRRRPRLRLLSLTDWDPHGWDSAHALKRTFEAFGFPDADLTFIARPELLSPEDLRRAAIPLRRRGAMAAALTRWMNDTGGIGGRPLKLETTAIPDRLLYEALARAVPRPDPPS